MMHVLIVNRWPPHTTHLDRRRRSLRSRLQSCSSTASSRSAHPRSPAARASTSTTGSTTRSRESRKTNSARSFLCNFLKFNANLMQIQVLRVDGNHQHLPGASAPCQQGTLGRDCLARLLRVGARLRQVGFGNFIICQTRSEISAKFRIN